MTSEMTPNKQRLLRVPTVVAASSGDPLLGWPLWSTRKQPEEKKYINPVRTAQQFFGDKLLDFSACFVFWQ